MYSRWLAVFVMLGMATSAFAGARIELIPDVAGPYLVGQVVNVDAWLVDTGNPQGDILFRGLFLDFTDSYGVIPGTFNWENPFGVGAVFPELPNTAWIYPLGQPNPLFQIRLPDGGQVHLGDINVTVIGWFRLDAMNADATDPNLGARADFGFGGPDDPVTTWRASSGELTGWAFTPPVPVEPTTLALLGLGAGALIRRRRR